MQDIEIHDSSKLFKLCSSHILFSKEVFLNVLLSLIKFTLILSIQIDTIFQFKFTFQES